MKKNEDYFEAFKQLFVILSIIIWIGWLYMFLTGSSSTMMHVSKYGRSSFNTINANGMLFMAIMISIWTGSLFLVKKKRKP